MYNGVIIAIYSIITRYAVYRIDRCGIMALPSVCNVSGSAVRGRIKRPVWMSLSIIEEHTLLSHEIVLYGVLLSYYVILNKLFDNAQEYQTRSSGPFRCCSYGSGAAAAYFHDNKLIYGQQFAL